MRTTVALGLLRRIYDQSIGRFEPIVFVASAAPSYSDALAVLTRNRLIGDAEDLSEIPHDAHDVFALRPLLGSFLSGPSRYAAAFIRDSDTRTLKRIDFLSADNVVSFFWIAAIFLLVMEVVAIIAMLGGAQTSPPHFEWLFVTAPFLMVLVLAAVLFIQGSVSVAYHRFRIGKALGVGR